MIIELDQPILAYNDRLAEANRRLLAENKVCLVDVLASPGAGKTSLILASIELLRPRFRIAVIEGDVASDIDAQRVKQAGVPAVQINTGSACHLEAAMVGRALEALPLDELDLVFVENIGNLVCPTDFDLGSALRVVVLSVPEGDDKPQKYPGIFGIADACIVNKLDALPLFDFDLARFTVAVSALAPQAPVFSLSARTGEGLADWCDWLAKRALDDVG